MPMREGQDTEQKPAGLSTNQLISLRWVSEGRTLKEVAMIEGTDMSTVAEHLSEACERLGVATIKEAVAKASQLKLLQKHAADDKP